MNPDRHYQAGASKFTRAIIVCFLSLLLPLGHAQESVKQCANANVRLIRISVDGREPFPDTTPQIIEAIPAQASETTSNVAGKAVTLVAVGPVLGSMDSREIETGLECTTNGFTLTATITRSADYHGAVQKSVLWRPRIELAVVFKKPEVIANVIWKARLTTGADLNHVETPPYPDQKYPITVMETLR